MLQIKSISKRYKTGDFVQQALDKVSLNLRDSEFVAILGPSGSGKTTLLNIIGGLDRYDDGDLVINGISTRQYKDRDWDSYRNHTIGFVFQSYNLIPHQTILSNVELALTISGIGKADRRERARKALEKVEKADADLVKVLEGPTSIMFANVAKAPAVLIKEFRKKSEKPVLKAAFAEGCVYVGDNQLDALCNIKSKEELIGDIIALLQSPAKNVISALQANAGQKIAGIVKTLESRNN